MSFTASLQQSRANNICLVRAPTHGGDAWYYVRVKAGMMDRLIKDVSKGGVNLLEYGEIIKSGFGQNPPQEVKDAMKAEYNFESAN